jgi:hypothetical protein
LAWQESGDKGQFGRLAGLEGIRFSRNFLSPRLLTTAKEQAAGSILIKAILQK